MLNCSHLQACGLSIKLVDGKLRLSPAGKVTDQVRQYVLQNRDAIVSELNSIHMDDVLKSATIQFILSEFPGSQIKNISRYDQ
jgi:hypothetical protein